MHIGRWKKSGSAKSEISAGRLTSKFPHFGRDQARRAVLEKGPG
jgi:hypothetical protein